MQKLLFVRLCGNWQPVEWFTIPKVNVFHVYVYGCFMALMHKQQLFSLALAQSCLRTSST